MFLALFVFFTLLAYYTYISLTSRPHPKFPPGPYKWPILGGYLQLLVENYRFPYKAIHWMARRYNTEVLGVYFGSDPTVITCSMASSREILNHPNMQGRAFAYVPSRRDNDGVIKGQFFTDGHRWTEQRRFMLRNLRDFGFGTRSKTFERVIEEELRDFIDLVQTKDVKGVCHDGTVTVPPAFYAYFLNLSLHIFLGSRMPPSQHHKLREFVYTAYKFLLALDPTTGAINMIPWIRHVIPELSGFNTCMRSNDFIKKFIQELVQEHKDTYLSDAHRDFCDVYIKEMKEKEKSDTQHWFEDEQLVMTFWDTLFPSSMTQTATMGFAVEFLLHYPEVQARIHQEIDNVVGRSRLPNLDDRKNMPYTDAVLREVLRRETLAPLTLPHRCTEDTYFRGYFIPKNTTVLASLYSCNMDETVWAKPFEFNPDRHLDENGLIKKKDLIMSFGLGKHVCSGETYSRQNMFLLLSTMLQHFSLELPPGQPLPDLEKHVPGLIISPKYFQVNMVPR